MQPLGRVLNSGSLEYEAEMISTLPGPSIFHVKCQVYVLSELYSLIQLISFEDFEVNLKKSAR